MSDVWQGALDFDRLTTQVTELKRWSAAIPDADSTGKIRGKLAQLETSLTESRASGDVASFRRGVEALDELVRRIHAADPLTQLCQRVIALRQTLDDRTAG
jgi:hypothetical protein